MKKWIILIGLIVLAGVGYAQVAGIPSFPPNFSYSLPTLPPSQSLDQVIFANCPYIHPIELSKVNVYSINGTALQPEILAEIQIYTNNKKSKCSFKKNFIVSPSINSSGLVSNFETTINNELLNEINSNQQAYSPPTPISSTIGVNP